MLRDGSLSVVYQRPGRKTSLGRSDYQGHRFDLRFLRPFRADLSIRKSSSFFPPLIASTSQRGLAPRPAQVSPDGLRYFGGTFLPSKHFHRLARQPRQLPYPSSPTAFQVRHDAQKAFGQTRFRRTMSASTVIPDRFIPAIVISGETVRL